VNVERAVDAVWRAHQEGGRVLSREAAFSMVRLVLISAGVSIEVRLDTVSDQPGADKNPDV
jgi:hypothetical protein